MDTNEITHLLNEDGNLEQIVRPATLRALLDAQGNDYTRPADFGPDDEWDVGDEE